ncbi:lanthionine synthetase C family protein [Neochlamydia sp. AcF84]|uniref:lanthionine synthetase C family protein n=1 Tax=Neochlamydia sp. AcF84 TaxID=2315858 RepID=UPI001F61B776|nr:lanthionine synthetase C family protein [Neochlamydia sp. AcF84]
MINIIQRMKDPSAIKAFMQVNANPDPIIPHHASWDDLSLAGGYPSLVLLFSAMQSKGLVKEDIVHPYVLKIKESIETKGISDLSLFSGASGICFALQQATLEGNRYQRMLHSLNNFMLERIEKFYLEPLKTKLAHNQSVPSHLYDVVQGLAGVGRYVLENLSLPHFYELAQSITKVFISLTHPLSVEGHHVPGWHLSSTDILNAHNDFCKKGNFNLGLAHGIPGVLSFFAIASLRGINIEGQADAMRQIALWLRKKSFIRQEMIQWSHSISFEDEIQEKIGFNKPSKDAWCYGVPGIARALFLAGKALKDEELKSFAATAFRGIFQRKREEWQLLGPMLCHGISGLLLITHTMAQEEGCGDLFSKVNELKQILFSSYDPEAPFGFKDIEFCSQGGQAEVSKAGFLEGTTGVLLTLLSLSYPTSKWHLPLLIHE